MSWSPGSSSTFSVVIPAHNAAGTIVRAIESAFGQSVPPQELIVGCDGCTDATAELAEGAGAVALKLPKANGSVARNAAALRAHGEYLFFLDADDWWEPRKIEVHMEVWRSGKPSFVIDRSTPVWPDGTRAQWKGGLDRTGEASWQEFLSYRAWASGSSFSVCREHFDRVGGFNVRLNKFQDVDFWVRCAHECGPAQTLSQSFTNYSLSALSTVSKTASMIEENLDRVFESWPFASQDQRAAFASHAYLTVAEVTPWPQSIGFFKKANWPLSKPFFWKCLRQSLHRRGA